MPPVVGIFALTGGPAAFAPEEAEAAHAASVLGWDVSPILSAIILARVIFSFRGAWLQDPEDAPRRVPGFFAGTVAAVFVGLLPWLLLSFAIAAWVAAPLDALRAVLAHHVAFVLAAAAWTAVAILVCVLVESLEARWAAGLLAWSVLAFLLPTAGMVSIYAWGDGGEAFLMGSVPPWALVLDALSPERLRELLVASTFSTPPFEGAAYQETYPVLFRPLTFVVGLLLWAAAPLALATRLQARRADAFPLSPEVSP